MDGWLLAVRNSVLASPGANNGVGVGSIGRARPDPRTSNPALAETASLRGRP